MRCQDFESLLQPFADGELEGAESAMVQSHLMRCSACRGQVDGLKALHQAIRAASQASPVLSDDFKASLLQRLDEEADRMEREESSQRSRRAQRIWWAAAAACVLVFSGAVAMTLSASVVPERRETAAILYAKDAINRHRHHLPVEVTGAGRPQQVADWLKGKVDFNPGVPSLNKASLVGARLSNVREKQAAYFVYDIPQDKRVSLFAFDAPELEVPGGRKVADCDVMLTNQQGYNVVLWKNNEIAYSLVGELDERDILELVSCDGDGEKGQASASAEK